MDDQKAYEIFAQMKSQFYTTDDGASSEIRGSDEELRLILQRISKKSKKSLVTRAKALRQLSELIESRPPDFVETFLPLFSITLENIVISDSEHSILSETQTVIRAMTSRNPAAIKKHFAKVFPSMLFLCFDPREETSAEARSQISIFLKDETKIAIAISRFAKPLADFIDPILLGDSKVIKDMDKGAESEPNGQKYISLAAGANKELARILELAKRLSPEERDKTLGCFSCLEGEPPAFLRQLKRHKEEMYLKATVALVANRLFSLHRDRMSGKGVEGLIREVLIENIGEPNQFYQAAVLANSFLAAALRAAPTLKVDSKNLRKRALTVVEKTAFGLGREFYSALPRLARELVRVEAKGMKAAAKAVLEALMAPVKEDRLRFDAEEHFEAIKKFVRDLLIGEKALEGAKEEGKKEEKEGGSEQEKDSKREESKKEDPIAEVPMKDSFEDLPLAASGDDSTRGELSEAVFEFLGQVVELFTRQHNPSQRSHFVVGVNCVRDLPRLLSDLLSDSALSQDLRARLAKDVSARLESEFRSQGLDRVRFANAALLAAKVCSREEQARFARIVSELAGPPLDALRRAEDLSNARLFLANFLVFCQATGADQRLEASDLAELTAKADEFYDLTCLVPSTELEALNLDLLACLSRKALEPKASLKEVAARLVAAKPQPRQLFALLFNATEEAGLRGQLADAPLSRGAPLDLSTVEPAINTAVDLFFDAGNPLAAKLLESHAYRGHPAIAAAFLCRLATALERPTLPPGAETAARILIALLETAEHREAALFAVLDATLSQAPAAEAAVNELAAQLPRADPATLGFIVERGLAASLARSEWSFGARKVLRAAAAAGGSRGGAFWSAFDRSAMSMFAAAEPPAASDALQAAIRLAFTSAKASERLRPLLEKMLGERSFAAVSALAGAPFSAANFRDPEQFDFWWNEFMPALTSALKGEISREFLCHLRARMGESLSGFAFKTLVARLVGDEARSFSERVELARDSLLFCISQPDDSRFAFKLMYKDLFAALPVELRKELRPEYDEKAEFPLKQVITLCRMRAPKAKTEKKEAKKEEKSEEKSEEKQEAAPPADSQDSSATELSSAMASLSAEGGALSSALAFELLAAGVERGLERELAERLPEIEALMRQSLDAELHLPRAQLSFFHCLGLLRKLVNSLEIFSPEFAATEVPRIVARAGHCAAAGSAALDGDLPPNEFLAELAETLSRFALRPELGLPLVDLFGLLNSPSNALQKAGFLLLTQRDLKLGDVAILDSDTLRGEDLGPQTDQIGEEKSEAIAALQASKAVDVGIRQALLISPPRSDFSFALGWISVFVQCSKFGPHVANNSRLFSAFFEALPEEFARIFRRVFDHFHSRLSESNLARLASSDLGELLPRWGDFRSEELEDLAMLTLFFWGCSVFPRAMRRLLNDPERRAQSIGAALLRLGVGRSLFAREASGAEALKNEFGPHELDVKVAPRQREIRATYEKGGANVELTLVVPEAYPLKPVDAQIENESQFAKKMSARWILVLRNILGSQNSGVAESLRVWKLNLEKQFENVEECSVCYYVIYPTNKSTPDMPCRTCRKRFHKICVSQWINSSGKSNCPLCKSLLF